MATTTRPATELAATGSSGRIQNSVNGEIMQALTREHAQRIAARIAAAPVLLPQTAEGRTELVNALLRHCGDVDHAERTMTEMLDNSPDVHNVVAELAIIARRIRTPELAPPGCAVCSLGPDPITGAARWLPYVSMDRGGCAFAGRCTCERGHWLSARDAQREFGEVVPTTGLAMAGARQAVDVRLLQSGDD
jgi:hypothetical protein